jgi:diguanylate cyclase (GGDEF)-like protein
MKPIKVSQLSLAFTALLLFAFIILSGLTWNEIRQLSARIDENEHAAAAREVNEGVTAVEDSLRAMAEKLGDWNETRQQLVYPEYYVMWRDLRIRDAGIVASTVTAVALYDKNGRILAEPRGEFMPTRLDKAQGRIQFSGAGDERNVYVWFPVYADPEHQIRLGHGAIKLDFPLHLRQVRAYRYADLRDLRIVLKAAPSDSLAKIFSRIDYGVVANRELDSLTGMFQVTMIRLLAALLAILVLGGWFINRIVVGPLNRLSRDIDNLKNAPGDLRNLAPLASPMRVLELENVRRSFSDYHEKLASLRQDLEKTSQDFFDQARHDALTGAFNRRAFDEDWRALADAGYLGKCALLLFDCDHFKAINDTYGHGVGDQVIQAIAHNLGNALRTGDRLYRLGGDEFATMLPNSDAASAEAVAERCQQHIRNHDFLQYGLKEPVSISIGIAMSEHSAFNLHELHTRADLAMYSAKRPGNRKIIFHDDHIDGMTSLVSNQRINAVYNAVQHAELIQAHYQAIVALPEAKKPVFLEALARIRHHDELLSPAEFLPIVRNHRLDVEFDLAVLRAIDEDIRIGRVQESPGLCINISPLGILDERVVHGLIGLRARAAGRGIVVEITEAALTQQFDKASDNIARLRDAGCQVALDDFGSGYSSLRHLASMPVDIVKFDISIIHQLISEDPKQRQIVGEFANIVSAYGYQIVAEGVETQEHLERVIALGFDFAQGYHLD